MSLFDRIFGKETITSFENVTLRISGMRAASEYVIVMKDGMAELSEYNGFHQDEGDAGTPRKRVTCGADRVLKLMNGCGLLSWDGFHGKHPKGVRDGTAFILKAAVNGGKTIFAHGSQNFPAHYREFTDGVRDILNDPENVAQ
jgi:hypothetical protein